MISKQLAVHDSIPSCNQKAILNATSKPAPPETSILLSLGPKFALPYTNVQHIPFFHLIADVENILSEQLDKTIRENMRCQIINKMQNFINLRKVAQSTTQLDKFCSGAIAKTRRFVRENPDILITNADKGNKTVIMYVDDYNVKMNALLSDSNIYKQVKTDPTNKIQKETNAIIQRLLGLQLIDKKTKYRLACSNGTCPRIYGQPKAHKPGLPVRPVIPNITSPTYNLSKYIANILQKSFTSEFNVKDSRSFCEYANNFVIPEGHVMVSFDVVSLFTNVPKRLVIHDITMMWDKVAPHTNINLDLFLEIVGFCIDSSYCSFQGRFFMQIFGTAMGSPLSPIAADIVTEKLLKTVTVTANIPYQHIKKYVDDLFLVLPRDRIDSVLEAFNSYNANLQFTCEMEKDNQLPFLDLLIIRCEDNTVKTDWYAKPISSGRLLNFHSMHPTAQKLGVVAGFISRVRSLSTARSTREQNDLIMEHLKLNDYPRPLIHRLLQQPHRPAGETTSSASERPVTYRSIPNVPGLTQTIKSILQQNNPHIGIATNNRHNVKQLCNTAKDRLPDAQQSNVVYKVRCQHCDCSYIGMTTNRLRERMYGHQTHINALERHLQAGLSYEHDAIQQLREKTALVDHCVAHKHRFSLKEPAIVDRTFSPRTLPILEMCHIYTTANTVNRRTDTEGISCSYAHLLESIAATKKKRTSTTSTNTTIPSTSLAPTNFPPPQNLPISS